jgi:hypothetical protein
MSCEIVRPEDLEPTRHMARSPFNPTIFGTEVKFICYSAVSLLANCKSHTRGRHFMSRLDRCNKSLAAE